MFLHPAPVLRVIGVCKHGNTIFPYIAYILPHAYTHVQALSKNKRRKNRKDRTANTGDGEGGEGGEGGSIFVREVEAVLRSERHWQQWKGRKCASYVQQATSLTKALQLESTERYVRGLKA